MTKISISLILLLLASITINCFVFLNNKPDQIIGVNWPAGTKWVEVVHDATIQIMVSDSPDRMGIEYDVEKSSLTLKKFFHAAIAWKDNGFVNIVSWGPLSNGAYMTRINEANKSVIYSIRLLGIGPVDHSQYSNSVSVYLNRDLVMTIGREGAGNYNEIRRIKDGSLVYINQNFKGFPQYNILTVK